MTKCFNCCGQSFDSNICPNCNHPAYRMSIDTLREFDETLVIAGSNGFSSVGPLHYQTQGLMSYAVSSEWVNVALDHPTLSVLFCRESDAQDCDITLVFSDNPLRDFVRFHNYLTRETQFYSTSPTIIHQSSHIHRTAVLMDNVKIGTRTTVSPNVTLGMDGARFAEGERIEHAGGVRVGNDCFIGAGTVIVKGVWGNDTQVGDRTFVGNLVNIGHNCVIGNDCVILPGAVLCGSVTIGNGARISPGAVVSDHVKIGDGAFVTLGAVVTRDVLPGEWVSGNFAVKHSKWIDFVKRLAE